MPETVSEDSIVIECSSLNARAIGEKLREIEPEASVVLRGVDGRLSGFAAGVESEFNATVAGSVGDFAFMLCQEADWEVDGAAGHCCGHSLASGRVLIRGPAADYLGAFIQGGFIAVLGGAGNRCGYRNAGGDILIRSLVGNEAGAYMSAGDLVLANGAGENLGHGMQGGVIYLRGDAASIAPCVRHERMKDADSMRLSLLLARAGIKGDVKEFKVYRPRGN
ncbi:MAG: hypothetical protein AAF483_13330 [Planctomycetota bacterium]